MQPARARLICRSHNPFTPSIALWQHFVLPGRPFVHQQRPAYSTVTKDEPSLSSKSQFGNAQTPTIIQNDANENNEDNPTHESPPPPLAPSIRAVYNSVPDDSSLRSTLLKDLPVRQAGQRKNHPWVDNERDADAEAKPNSPEALLVQTQNTVDKTGDYEAVIMKSRPVKNKDDLTETNLPWVFQGRGLDVVPAMERLEVEMMRFHEYMKPSQGEELVRRQLVEQVRLHTREALPTIELEVFGSQRTGLAFATSDIDLRLLEVEELKEPTSNGLPPTMIQRKRLLHYITRLHKHLREKFQYEHCVILHARYPLVSFHDKASGLEVQVVLANDTSLSRAMITKFIEEYPFICPVYSVVKTMLDIRGLSDTFRGGFGSYPVFMMIVASFRHCGWDTPPASAGEGLKAFLDFWASFDTNKKGISLEPTELYDKATDAPMTSIVREKLQKKGAKPAPDFCLSLRDPADQTNDLGRKGIAIKHLQTTLTHSVRREFYKRLLRNKDVSLLHPLVTPVYGLTISDRKKLREQGLKLFDRRLVDDAKQIRETPTLRMPSDEEWVGKPESKPEEIKQTVPLNPEGIEKVSKSYQEVKEEMMKKGFQVPSIAHVGQEFRSKGAIESQRNYEKKKRKSEKAMKRFKEAQEKIKEKAIAKTTVEPMEANTKLEAAPEAQAAEPPEAVTEQAETRPGYVVKIESEGEATSPSDPVEPKTVVAAEITQEDAVSSSAPETKPNAVEEKNIEVVKGTPNLQSDP